SEGAAAARLRRFFPPREPRRVFLFRGEAPFSAGGSSSGASAGDSGSTAGATSPRSSGGRWIVVAPAAAAAGFLRLRPPREPRLVFFFGAALAGSVSDTVSVSGTIS